MKKLFVASLLIASIVCVNAASTSTTVATTTCSNLVTLISGAPGTITSVVFTSPAASVGSAKLYDSSSTAITYTNASYTTVSSYATNYISSWTNYYGVVNNATNLVLMQVTNTVAASTNSVPLLLTMSAGTNTSVTYSGLNMNFQSGLAVTNTGAGTIQVTVNYTQ